jgi:cytochrome bd-type quinol oxidase subunit 2
MEKITKKIEIIVGISVVVFTIIFNTFVKIYNIDTSVRFQNFYDIYLIIISLTFSITLLIARKQKRRLYILFVFYLLAVVLSIILNFKN